MIVLEARVWTDRVDVNDNFAQKRILRSELRQPFRCENDLTIWTVFMVLDIMAVKRARDNERVSTVEDTCALIIDLST